LSPSRVDKMEDKQTQANKKAEEVARAAEDAEDAAQAERIRLLRLENTRLLGIKAASDFVLMNLQGPPPPPPPA
jgi:hypothetical protein